MLVISTVLCLAIPSTIIYILYLRYLSQRQILSAELIVKAMRRKEPVSDKEIAARLEIHQTKSML